MKYNSYGSSLAEIVPNQLRGVFESSVLSIWGHTLTSRHQARIIKAIQTQAEKAAASGEFDLVYLHLPAPHPPHVFDRRSGKFNLSNQPIRGYTDSLALTDLTLGRLHEVMRDAGLWDTSTVIVTSDHFSSDAVLFDGKRSSRVPFMVKLPGQRSEVVYSRPVETIISKSLVLSILKGSISTPEQLVGFLETASTQR